MNKKRKVLWKWRKIVCLFILMFLISSIILWNVYANNTVHIQTNILSTLITKVIKIIDKHLANFKTILETSGIQIPDYQNIQAFINTYYTGLADKIKFDKHLTTDFIVWIHYRENHNNTDYNPTNWDGVFQLDSMEWKVKNPIYCTKPDQYNEIYKTCIWPWNCQDFSKQLVYEYCDYIQFMKHKFGSRNIQKEAIYWREYRWTYIKWMKQMLKKIDINIPDEIWWMYLENVGPYLKENNAVSLNYLDTDLNFEFTGELTKKYNIKNYKQFIGYLYKNYFKALWIDENFVRALFEVFQDSVIASYYNWLWANWWSWITKSYAMNIPPNFANLLGIQPYVAKKPSWRWYLVDDAQIWAVVYYFYTKHPDWFKYIILIKKLWLDR